MLPRHEGQDAADGEQHGELMASSKHDAAASADGEQQARMLEDGLPRHATRAACDTLLLRWQGGESCGSLD